MRMKTKANNLEPLPADLPHVTSPCICLQFGLLGIARKLLAVRELRCSLIQTTSST